MSTDALTCRHCGWVYEADCRADIDEYRKLGPPHTVIVTADGVVVHRCELVPMSPPSTSAESH